MFGVLHIVMCVLNIGVQNICYNVQGTGMCSEFRVLGNGFGLGLIDLVLRRGFANSIRSCSRFYTCMDRVSRLSSCKVYCAGLHFYTQTRTILPIMLRKITDVFWVWLWSSKLQPQRAGEWAGAWRALCLPKHAVLLVTSAKVQVPTLKAQGRPYLTR